MDDLNPAQFAGHQTRLFDPDAYPGREVQRDMPRPRPRYDVSYVHHTETPDPDSSYAGPDDPDHYINAQVKETLYDRDGTPNQKVMPYASAEMHVSPLADSFESPPDPADVRLSEAEYASGYSEHHFGVVDPTDPRYNRTPPVHGRDREIGMVHVSENLRRMGIGAGLLKTANRIVGPVKHSSTLSDAGRAYAMSRPEQANLAKRADVFHHLPPHDEPRLL